MHDIFVYGTLCHPPMLAAVLGREGVTARAAVLPGHAVRRAHDDLLPVPVAAPGAAADGLLLTGLSDEDAARLDWFEAGFGYTRRAASVICADTGGAVAATAWFPPDGVDGAHAGAQAWDLDEWIAARGAVVVATAADALAARERGEPAGLVFARWPQMLVRAASRLRAEADTGPRSLRRDAVRGDVATVGLRAPYANFFAVEEADLRLRQFGGDVAPPVTRAAFVIGDAVTVLPYDPVRDRVLLVEQFRAGAHLRGDPQPWLLEAVAGRIDGFETPEDAARRETLEEAGITLSRLVPAAQYYPSPGAVAEYLYSFVGLADLPDTGDWLSGLEAEAEDIRAHVIGFDRLMALVGSGEVRNAPLLITALWLSQAREGLRRAG